MRRFLTAPLRNARFSPLSFLRTLRARTATRRSGYPCFASAFRETSRGPFSERPPQTVEKPLESSRGPEPSRTTIVPGGVNGGDGRVFAVENSIFQSKNRFFAVFAAGIRRIQAKTGAGGRGGGACFPVHRLVKAILTSRLYHVSPPLSREIRLRRGAPVRIDSGRGGWYNRNMENPNAIQGGIRT